MLFDLSPYLSFNAFVAIWIIGLMALACVGDYFDNKKGK